MSFDSDESFWAQANYDKGREAGDKDAAKYKKALEKIMTESAPCGSDWGNSTIYEIARKALGRVK